MSSAERFTHPDSADTDVSTSESDIDSSPFEGTSYGRSTSLLNDVIARLNNCGVSQFVDLPKIAVIGNQSAGKSSLIEAISQVKVPRSNRTCTRCPMEVILRRGCGKRGEWSCCISLRMDHDDNGKKIGDSNPIFFAYTKVKADVTDLLRRAQLAILNPKKDPNSFVEGNLDNIDDMSMKFSWNTVVMEINGHRVDITLIDLPGMISSAEEGEDAVIAMVDRLVDSYVRQSKCLILVTIAMTNDIENQSGARKAKTFDKTGQRTIGVLTKPDMIGEGDHDKWLSIVRNEEWKLKHGWYVTRQCSTAEIAKNLSAEEVRANEELFFENTEPWHSTVDDGRLGTSRLVDALGDLLSNMIRESLPKLQATISERLDKVDQGLARLPQSLSDKPQWNLVQKCQEFSQKIHQYAVGHKDHPEFVRSTTDIFRQFRTELLETIPTFQIHLDKKNYWIWRMQTPETGRSVANASSAAASKRPCLKLGDVEKIIADSRTRELPIRTPPLVDDRLVSLTTEKWGPIAEGCFEKVNEQLFQTVMELRKSYFVEFPALYEKVAAILAPMLNDVASKTREEIRTQCAIEMRYPFTMNEKNLIQAYTKEQVRIFDRLASHNPASDPFGGSAQSGGPVEDLSHKFQPLGDYTKEYEVISGALAYYQIASQRMIDFVPMRIEHHLVHGFSDAVKEKLVDMLGLLGNGGEERCAELVKMDPKVERERDSLNQQKEILVYASEILRAI